VDTANRPHSLSRLRGSLDRGALLDAIALVSDRHSALRLGVRDTAQGPLLVARATMPRPTEHRISRRSVADGLSLAVDLTWSAYDLTGAPLARTFLIKLGAQDHIFGVGLHHFVGDAISIGIVNLDIQYAYSMLSRHRTPKWPSEPLQYLNYLQAIRVWSNDQANKSHFAYWRKKLGSARTFSGAPAAPRAAGSSVQFSIDEIEAGKIRRLGETSKAGTFAVLLAAQFVALRDLSGRDDNIIATITHGREMPVLRSVVGYLADRTLHRVDLLGTSTPRSVVERVHVALREASRHSFVRYNILQDKLGLRDGSIAAPVFGYRSIRASGDRSLLVAPGWSRLAVPSPGQRSGLSPALRLYRMDILDTASGMRGALVSAPDLPSGFLEMFRAALAALAAPTPSSG